MPNKPQLRVRVPHIRVAAGVAYVGLLLALLPLTACERNVKPNGIGASAPAFTLADNTTTVRLSDYKGKTVVLNFWFSSCLPCIKEIPSLVEMQHEMPNLKVIAVSVDEEDAPYRAFLKRFQVDFTTVRDPQQKINHLYGTEKFPETYIIDRNGIIRRKVVSAIDWTNPEMLEYLSKL